MKSFQAHIAPLQEKIYRLCLAYTGHPQDAEDLRQEALYRAFRAFENFKQQSSFDTWMYRITVNCCLSWLQKHNNEKHMQVFDSRLEQEIQSANTHLDPEVQALLECIQQLKEVDRLLIELSLEGYKHKEIAEIMHMSHSAVSVRIHRIKDTLKTCMEL